MPVITIRYGAAKTKNRESGSVHYVVTRRTKRHLALGLALYVSVLMGLAAPAAAQDPSACASRFPAHAWTLVSEGASVATFRASVDESVAHRFAESATAAASMLAADLGEFPPTVLCVFGSDITLDAASLVDAGLLPSGQRLHAAAFIDEALLFVDTQQFRLVDDAIVLGLANIALWHSSGSDGYPEPLAGAVAQWYVARMADSLEQHHSTMRVFNFFNDPSGNAPPTDWFAGSQEPVAVWNPEFQESPIADFVESAVADSGTSIIVDPEPAVWEAADVAWRAGLRAELLQGAEGSRDWVGGVAIAVLVVVLAVATAWWGRRLSKRKQVPMGDIATVDGFFDTPST